MMGAIDDSASSMDTRDFFHQQHSEIVGAAGAALARLGVPHYQAADQGEVHRRIEVLFDHVADSLSSHDLGPLVSYAESVAEERFNGGYDLIEVQTAFNVLEEPIWARAVATLEPGQLAETLGLVSTALGCGKDALARKYVSLATRTHAPSLDLRALFRGSEGT